DDCAALAAGLPVGSGIARSPPIAAGNPLLGAGQGAHLDIAPLAALAADASAAARARCAGPGHDIDHRARIQRRGRIGMPVVTDADIAAVTGVTAVAAAPAGAPVPPWALAGVAAVLTATAVATVAAVATGNLYPQGTQGGDTHAQIQ